MLNKRNKEFHIFCDFIASVYMRAFIVCDASIEPTLCTLFRCEFLFFLCYALLTTKWLHHILDLKQKISEEPRKKTKHFIFNTDTGTAATTHVKRCNDWDETNRLVIVITRHHHYVRKIKWRQAREEEKTTKQKNGIKRHYERLFIKHHCVI